MKALKEFILSEGKYLGNGILKVDSFINHQVSPPLMMAMGGAMAAHFGTMGINKILTAEISGIAPALMAGLAMGVKIVYARKNKPVTMPKDVYVASAPSHTKGGEVRLMVSPEFLGREDRLLIIDDFLASGSTLTALIELARQAGAEVVGVGAIIEKQFEGGRKLLESQGIHVHSLVTIAKLSEDEIVFAD